MTETPISRTIRRLFASGGAVGMALLALPGHAQEAAPKPAPAQEAAPAQAPVARVEITGSNIRRSQSETASSVLTVNRADIERSGRQTVAELLQTLAVDNAGSVPTSFGNGFAAGASGISLRGLGVASTLVLINGRRVAPYGLADDGQKQFTDLNVIPADAVDRIEILLDGASAIYGSDAVAGVVNVILRRDFTGTTIRGQTGITRYWDGRQWNFAYTQGFGDLEADGHNAFFSVEYKKFREIWSRDRADRDYIGKIDLRPYGFSANEALGGTGAILRGQAAAGNAINGNVRNPATSEYYNRGDLSGDSGFTRLFPGAACQNFTRHPQGDPGGGCIIDSTSVYGQVLPKQENLGAYGRATFKLPHDIEAYAEVNLYSSATDTSTTPSAVSTSVGFPGGPVNNSIVQLGAAHPDNPYFGTAARLRYLAADVGPRQTSISSFFQRWVAGASGSHYGWDWNAGILFSHNHVTQDWMGYLQRDVAFALLDPSAANVAAATANSAAYRALPPGTVWRIGENAVLNSPAMYAALSPNLNNSADTRFGQVDFRITRSFAGLLPGGDLGVAAGVEWRHQYTELRPTSGTERGNIIGLGFSAYAGSRNVAALYLEALAPLLKNLELTAAGRIDHFTDDHIGTAYTPKVGIKYTPIRSLALRGNWGHGFRAPGPAENGKGGLAAFSTATDPARCALGVTSACNPAPVALITSPNPNLSPERSTNWDLGVIWDPLPTSSVSFDLWRIKRKDEINQGQVPVAIAAGSVARDPTGAVPGIAGDPGPITAVLVRYENSAETVVKGYDIDGRQRFKLPHDYGNLVFDIKWTHLYKWLRTDRDGTQRDFAGTHGNCDVTNCVGTPRNRSNFHATWERSNVRLTLSVNYRSKIQNVLFRGDPDGCASTFADGRPAPNGCELASFTTFDLVGRWKPAPKWEITASVLNLFDKTAPLDPLTYGAQAYNPLDFDGARGRTYTVGARYTF
jgi:iron complex outermembrane receptor protein